MIFYATKRQTITPSLHAFQVLMFIIALVFCMPLSITSKPITAQQAFKIAQKYLQLPAKQLTRSASSHNHSNQVAPYYVYNDTKNKGFVIVSGNTEMGEILAYSTESSFEEQSANPGAQLLLNAYREAFEAVSTGKNVAGATRAAAQSTKVVKPLVKTSWGQGHPYNQKTGYNYTGCVATAIAQVMKYHEWPVKGQGENEYTVSFDGTKKYVNFADSHYDWANMGDRYGYYYPSTAQQNDAVALLMRDCGYAVNMQYSENSSSSTGYAALYAMKNYFQYDAVLIAKYNEGIESFVRIIKKELINGFPLYIEGMPEGGRSGHAWVLDGVDKDGLFHMNFGWNGQSNGYYSLSALNLSQSGKEFNGAKLAFSRAFMAIFAHPNKTGVKRIDPSLMPERGNLSFTAEGAFTRKDGVERISNRMETYPVELSYIINKGLPFKGDVGVTVIDEQNNRVATAASQWHNEGGFTQQFFTGYGDGKMQTDGILSTPISVNVPLKGLKEGVYTLKVVSADYQDDNTWTDWVLLRKAPYMVIKVTADKVEVLEECSKTSSFKLVAEPFYDKTLNPGAKVTCNMAIKNLSGLPKDAYIKLSFLNDQGVAVFSHTSDKAFSFDSFGTDYAQFEMKLPTNLASGTYQTKVEVVGII